MSLCLCWAGHSPVKERSYREASPHIFYFCRVEPSQSRLLPEGAPALTYTNRHIGPRVALPEDSGPVQPNQRTMGFVHWPFPRIHYSNSGVPASWQCTRTCTLASPSTDLLICQLFNRHMFIGTYLLSTFQTPGTDDSQRARVSL